MGLGFSIIFPIQCFGMSLRSECTNSVHEQLNTNSIYDITKSTSATCTKYCIRDCQKQLLFQFSK